MTNKLHIYHWEDEPVDERPSEFATTGFSTMSGYHSSLNQPRPRPGRGGFPGLIVAAVSVLAVGAWVLHRFGHLIAH